MGTVAFPVELAFYKLAEYLKCLLMTQFPSKLLEKQDAYGLI